MKPTNHTFTHITNRIKALALATIFAASAPAVLAQGSLTPPGAPAPSMKTLQEIYDAISAVDTKVSNSDSGIEERLEALEGAVEGLASAFGTPVEYDWVLHNIENLGVNAAFDASIFVGPSGQPSISYYHEDDAELRYASFDGSTWTIEPAVAEGGTSNSHVVNSSGLPIIAYHDTDTSSLRMAIKFGGNWITSTIEAQSGEDIGANCDLALRQDGTTLGVAYRNAGTGKLSYAEKGTGAWQVDSNVATVSSGSPIQLYFDNTNEPIIGHSGGIEKAVGASWNTIALPLANDSGSGWSRHTGSTFWVTPDGDYYRVWNEFDGSTQSAQAWGRYDGTAWTTEIINTGVLDFYTFYGAAVSSEGNALFALKDSSGGFGLRDGSQPDGDVSHVASSGTDAEIAFTTDGLPVAVYFIPSSGEMVAAHATGRRFVRVN